MKCTAFKLVNVEKYKPHNQSSIKPKSISEQKAKQFDVNRLQQTRLHAKHYKTGNH